MSESTKITLETLIPFSTNDYHYLNRGAADLGSGQVYAYQAVAFSETCEVWAYLAISDAALDILLSRGHPAIPDFPSLLHFEKPRFAFKILAWNAAKIGVPREVIQTRGRSDFVQTGGALYDVSSKCEAPA